MCRKRSNAGRKKKPSGPKKERTKAAPKVGLSRERGPEADQRGLKTAGKNAGQIGKNRPKQGKAGSRGPKQAKSREKAERKQAKKAAQNEQKATKSSPKTGQTGAAVLQERKTAPSGSLLPPCCKRDVPCCKTEVSCCERESQKKFCSGQKAWRTRDRKSALQNVHRMMHRMSTDWCTECPQNGVKKWCTEFPQNIHRMTHRMSTERPENGAQNVYRMSTE